MHDEESLKLRYRCSVCKNLESHHASNKKRKCENCGNVLTEITEKDYRHYKSKLKKREEEEDKKEKSLKNKDKKEKKKKKSDEDEDNSDYDNKKNKHKLKRNLSTKNIEDKNYKLKKEIKETEDDLNISEISSSKKEHKHKKKERMKSTEKLEKLGPMLSKVVNNILKGGKHLEKGLKKLEKIDFSKYSGTDQTNISINHYNDRPTQIFINNKKINTDSFDPIFDQFPNIFGADFQTNFMQNFISTNQEYFQNNTNLIENEEDEDDSNNYHKPLKEESLAKLKRFKLNDKYCQKGKDGKLELPCCCICLSEIKKGKETILLPCAHMFHSKCCLNWLKDNNTCPMCRREIV